VSEIVRYPAEGLVALATTLLQRAGLDGDKAGTVAEILVEADLLGHTTHGLALLGQYLDELHAGRMARDGRWDVHAAGGAVETWDGRRLPGPWLVAHAAARAETLAAELGLGGVAIRRAGHIGCLAAYLRPVAERGRMLVIASSDPSTASVAPFGGTRRLTTPNPIAAGWPCPGGPVMIDVSMSVTTNGMTARHRSEGISFEHPWVMDSEGQATRDPNAFFDGGSLLPLGGLEAGHKGYALGLLVEALTSALAGHGRADAEQQWGASVLVLAIDPARFGGLAGFERETGWMAEQVHANPPRPGGSPPRLPGERGLALRREQLQHGVALHSAIAPELARRAAAAGIGMLKPISG
jgi:LDH2 family malate/lactate/ureidoglycolate dehydrogenase